MSHNAPSDSDSECLARILGNVLMLTVNETMVLAQLEALGFMSPTPASLPIDDGSPLDQKLDMLIRAIISRSRSASTESTEAVAACEKYANAVIHESITAFMRARMAVCRAHIYLIGSSLITERPELMHLPREDNIRRILIEGVENSFWEHLETAYARLVSFWDRIGQILAFVFFNSREFEHDGFGSVVDRVQANIVRVSRALRESSGWTRLRHFQTSERTDGLKWLLRRRNLLIHSMHLSPPGVSVESARYNHMEAIRAKLKPALAEDELGRAHQHLSLAASLFVDAVDVAVLGQQS